MYITSVGKLVRSILNVRLPLIVGRSGLLLILLFVFQVSLAQCSNSNNSSILVGFESIGLTEQATPAQVCSAIPVGSEWHAYFHKGKTSAWAGYHEFTGTVIAIKISEEKCLLYRIEDHYAESGWNASLSSATISMAEWTLDPKSTIGYVFTGFEPINGKSQAKMRNDGVAAMELVRICESYAGVIWQYDSKQHSGIGKNLKVGKLTNAEGFFTADNLPSYEEKYRTGLYKDKNFPVIDCQTLIKMAMAGIPYQYSHYADTSYQYRQLNAYPWAMQTPNIWLYELMEYCVNSGYEVAPGPNFENLQAGDLVFFGSSGEARNPQPRKVSHVAMFTGRWVADKGYKPIGASGKDYTKIYSFPVYDKDGQFLYNDTTTLHPQTIEVFQAPDKLPNTCVVRHGFLDSRSKNIDRRDNIVMFARLPLNTRGCWNNRNPWDNPANMIHTSDFDTEYRIDIIGDGTPVSLYVGSLNQAGILEGKNNVIMTGYMPYHPNAYEKLPHGAELKKVEYYDALMKSVASANKATYIRKYFVGTTLEAMQDEYMYNGVNQYKVMNAKEHPIIVYGILNKGERAVINTKTGRVYTSEGSRLTLIKGCESNPGMKVIYCPTGQEAMVTWNK